MPLIINADDLAIHPRISEGIFKAYADGVLTSASMLVTTPFFSETVGQLASTDLPVGLHLSLTLGKAISPASRLPELTDGDGHFSHDAMHFLFPGSGATRSFYDQITDELDAQIRLALDHGVRPTHLDSHQHVHMNPRIFEIVETLAMKYAIGRMRIVRERIHGFAAWLGLGTNIYRKNPVKVVLLRGLERRIRPRLATNDLFFGLMYSGNMSSDVLLRLAGRIRPDSVLELCAHPGYCAPEAGLYPQEKDNSFIRHPARERELAMLLDPAVKDRLRRRDIKLISFRGIPI